MTYTSMPPGDELLLALAAELLDAHLDTLELLLGWADELRWQAHLDYLRAMARRSEEILAAGLSAGEPVAARAGEPAAASAEENP